WVERKGILPLLDAFARLPLEAGILHLVGDQDRDPGYAARVRARVGEADLSRRVVAHGPVTKQRVAAFYAAADVFVLPSLKEPYGTVYGEAMAAGLPVVGWRAGNLPYLVQHNREGLLADPGDIQGLANALARLAYDEPLRLRLAQAARLRAQSLPTWQESADHFFEAIRSALRTED